MNDNSIIIFLNGEININFCKKYIINNKMESLKIICSDGSINKIQTDFFLSKIKYIIGDGDSFKDNEIIKQYNIEKIFLNNQNNTDFEKIILDLEANKNIYIFGSSGGEMDHFLNNISIAKKYFQKFNFTFIDEYSKYMLCKNTFIETDLKLKMISIIPLFKIKKVISKGLFYKLNNETLQFGLNIGIRNFAIQNQVEIYCKGLFIIHISHKNYQGTNAKNYFHNLSL